MFEDGLEWNKKDCSIRYGKMREGKRWMDEDRELTRQLKFKRRFYRKSWRNIMKRLEYRRKCGREASGHVTPSKRRSPDASSDHVTHLTKYFFLYFGREGGGNPHVLRRRDTVRGGGVAIFIFLSQPPTNDSATDSCFRFWGRKSFN